MAETTGTKSTTDTTLESGTLSVQMGDFLDMRFETMECTATTLSRHACAARILSTLDSIYWSNMQVWDTEPICPKCKNTNSHTSTNCRNGRRHYRRLIYAVIYRKFP